MSSTISKTDITEASTPTRWDRVRQWFSTWELYPILLLALFLRLYQLNSTEFDDDQAVIFRMAHDAIVHGLLPATSNIASIRIVNPPAVIYFLMVPAAFSGNPYGGAVLVALLNAVAVLLTYIFVRRYYSRLAAILAALLYATAVKPLEYSRFIWQQNMIAPLVLLFLFALFWGVVEQRKGWFFPALLLLGILYQLHEVTTILVVPLLAAFILAPGTVRWRDVALGLAALLLIFSTYLLWEVSNRFGDVYTLLKVSKLPSHIDNQALLYYRFFLSPYSLNPFEKPPTNPKTLVYSLIPVLLWVRRILLVLLAGGFIIALWELARPHKPSATTQPGLSALAEKTKRKWWRVERISPYKRGLLLLLVWQVIPLLFLSRHSVAIYPYYLLMLLPGPFILIGLCLAKVAAYIPVPFPSGFSVPKFLQRLLMYGVYILGGSLILLQFIGSTAAIIDDSGGNIKHGVTYNVLQSLQDAVTVTDQLAQQRHFNRVYIATDQFTESSLNYLARQMKTPTTLFDSSRCLILPNSDDGPALLLIGPADNLTTALMRHFASATLIDSPARLGGAPFQLYIVNPLHEPKQVALHPMFAQHLRLLDTKTRNFTLDNTRWVVTSWSLLRTEQPAFGTTYSYILTATLSDNSASRQSFLNFSSIRAGDEVLVAFDLPTQNHGTKTPPTVRIKAQSFTIIPDTLEYGFLRLETFVTRRTLIKALLTPDGMQSITLTP